MNVLVIGIDTLGAGHCGCYGYHRDTTPNLDALARRGVRLTNHYTVCPTCTPSWTSLVTGWAPTHHRVMATLWKWENLTSQTLDDRVPTLPELFQEAGYTTAMFSFLPSLMAHHPSWFGRGVEYRVNPGRSRTRRRDLSEISADRFNERLFPWLEQHRETPFFCFLTYWEPHQPYYHTPEFADLFADEELPVVESIGGDYIPGFGLADRLNERTRRSLDQYDRSVRYVDDRLGRLLGKLEELDLLDDTMIVVTADHGEAMQEHGIEFEHRGHWDPVTRVPMIWSHPSLPAGHEVETGTQAIDLAPSLLDLCGLTDEFAESREQMDGRTLRAELEGAKGQPGWHLITEQADDLAATRAVHMPNWMYSRRFMSTAVEPPVRYRGYEAPVELYHRPSDPYLLRNVAAERPEVVDEFEQMLTQWVWEKLGPNETDPMFDPLLLELNALRPEGDIGWNWDEEREIYKKTRDPQRDPAPERRHR